MSKLPNPQPSPQGQPRPQTPPPEKKPKPKIASTQMRLVWRVLISVLVVLHLTATFVAPWALGLQTQEPFIMPVRDAQGRTVPANMVRPEQIREATFIPVMADKLYRFFSHYNDLLYTNGGYEYFTPDPVAGHLLRFQVFDASGQKIAEGQLPDRRDQWPRLLYHRHMMLVDQTQDMPDSAGYAVAAHLLEKYNGQRIHMQLIRHHLLKPQDVLAGKKLDDPSTYELIGEMDSTRDHPKPTPLPGPEPPAAPGEVISLPEGQR
jgi:hypothetical protein